jgi:hypothetical protein
MNTFNVVVDTWNVYGDDTETMLIAYAVCHMVGMSSVSSFIPNVETMTSYPAYIIRRGRDGRVSQLDESFST